MVMEHMNYCYENGEHSYGTPSVRQNCQCCCGSCYGSSQIVWWIDRPSVRRQQIEVLSQAKGRAEKLGPNVETIEKNKRCACKKERSQDTFVVLKTETPEENPGRQEPAIEYSESANLRNHALHTPIKMTSKVFRY